MNCREVQTLLSTRHDGTLDAAVHGRMEAHLADCPICRRVQADLTAGYAGWREDNRRVTVPDPQREWWEVRRQLRDAAAPARASRPARRLALFWGVLPAAAAAALALLWFLPPAAPEKNPATLPAPAVARANSVDIPGGNASTMVFVDDRSGWLIVWASDATARTE